MPSEQTGQSSTTSQQVKGESELTNMSRTDLDQHARDQGINPDDYKDRQELLNAIKSKNQ